MIYQLSCIADTKKQKFNAIFTCAEKHMKKKRTVWTYSLHAAESFLRSWPVCN